MLDEQPVYRISHFTGKRPAARAADQPLAGSQACDTSRV
jgi:hypothetical protein